MHGDHPLKGKKKRLQVLLPVFEGALPGFNIKRSKILRKCFITDSEFALKILIEFWSLYILLQRPRETHLFSAFSSSKWEITEIFGSKKLHARVTKVKQSLFSCCLRKNANFPNTNQIRKIVPFFEFLGLIFGILNLNLSSNAFLHRTASFSVWMKWVPTPYRAPSHASFAQSHFGFWSYLNWNVVGTLKIALWMFQYTKIWFFMYLTSKNFGVNKSIFVKISNWFICHKKYNKNEKRCWGRCGGIL